MERERDDDKNVYVLFELIFEQKIEWIHFMVKIIDLNKKKKKDLFVFIFAILDYFSVYGLWNKQLQ